MNVRFDGVVIEPQDVVVRSHSLCPSIKALSSVIALFSAGLSRGFLPDCHTLYGPYFPLFFIGCPMCISIPVK